MFLFASDIQNHSEAAPTDEFNLRKHYGDVNPLKQFIGRAGRVAVQAGKTVWQIKSGHSQT